MPQAKAGRGNMTSDTVQERGNKLSKLTALGLREAALDSPAFRTSVNHFHTQVLELENWIQENTNLSKNAGLVQTRRDEESLINRLLPPLSFLNNGLVENQTYTPSMVNEFQEALNTFSSSISTLMYGNPETYLTTYLDILIKVVKPYKEARENFDYYQGRYDSLNKNYHDIKVSSLISADSIREKAMELYDIRNLYKNASFDLIWNIGKIQMKLDDLISKMIELTIPSTSQKETSKKYRINISHELEHEYSQYRKWTDTITNCVENYNDELHKAKLEINKSFESHYSPPEDLKTYDISTINSNLLKSEEIPQEFKKSGWLFVKTKARTSGKVTWLKRWCFFENGMFGMLMPSPSKLYVEESDKFGILLITCNYNPQEDRRYCFDLKIMNTEDSSSLQDIIITMQAETLKDLSEWMNLFNYAKKEALKLDKDSPEVTTLLSRVSPTFVEFACSSTTQIDFQTTSISEHKTHSLLNIIQANPNKVNDFGVFQDPTFRFPVMTQMTKLAVIARAFVIDQGITNAISANIWGISSSYPPPSMKPTFEVKFMSSMSDWNPIVYPSYYPEKYKSGDLLFRSVFNGFIKYENTDKELFLFKETCIFHPNENKRYPSTMFVTSNTLYFYVNFLGFISLSSYPFRSIISVSVVQDKNTKSNPVVEIELKHKRKIAIEVFYSDPFCLCEKILTNLENNLKNNEARADQLIKKLEKKDHMFTKTAVQNTQNLMPELSLLRVLNVDKMNLRQRQQQFQLEHDAYFKMDFNAPSRALMHLAFGDKSTVFHECTFLSRSKVERDAVGPWIIDPETKKVVRKMRISLKLARPFVSANTVSFSASSPYSYMDILQSVNKTSENFYYEVDQSTGYFSLPFTKLFHVNTKYVIINHRKDDYISTSQKDTTTSCTLYTYYNVVFVNKTTLETVSSLNFIDSLIKVMVLSILRNESRILKHVLSSYVGKLGNSSKIVKSMRLGGQIGVSERQNAPYKDYLKQSASNQVVYSKMLVFKLVLKWLILFWSKLCINAIRFFFSMVYGLMTNLMMLNKLVVGMLLISIVLNLSLSKRATFEYWAFKKAEKYADSVIDMKSMNMERSVSLDQLSILTKELTYKTDVLESFISENAKNKPSYQKIRNEMALKRNELLVELSLLNNIEKELIGNDFKMFLIKEIEKCNTVRTNYKDAIINNTELQKYCFTCEDQLKYFTDLL